MSANVQIAMLFSVGIPSLLLGYFIKQINKLLVPCKSAGHNKKTVPGFVFSLYGLLVYLLA